MSTTTTAAMPQHRPVPHFKTWGFVGQHTLERCEDPGSRTFWASASPRVSFTVTARTTWPWRYRRQAALRRPDGRRAYPGRTPRNGSARRGDGQIEQARRGRHAAVIRHDRGELITEQLRRRQVDSIEASQHAGVDDRRGIEKLIVDLHEIQPLQEASRPRERRRPVATDGTKDFDSRQSAGSPRRFVGQVPAERRGLRLSDDELHQRRRIEVNQRLSLPGPGAGQDGARARSTGHGGQRRTEVEQISGRRDDAPAPHEALDMPGATHGNQQGDRATSRRDFHGAPALDESQVFSGALPELSHAD